MQHGRTKSYKANLSSCMALYRQCIILLAWLCIALLSCCLSVVLMFASSSWRAVMATHLCVTMTTNIHRNTIIIIIIFFFFFLLLLLFFFFFFFFFIIIIITTTIIILSEGQPARMLPLQLACHPKPKASDWLEGCGGRRPKMTSPVMYGS